MAGTQIKVKATLPSGEVKSLSFPQRTTVEQVKNKFFEFVPPRFRKEPYFILVGNAVLDLEFYKLLDAHQTVKAHLEGGTELEISFITQMDAKRKKDKGEVETVTPHAFSVTKDFVDQQKHKDRPAPAASTPAATDGAANVEKRAEDPAAKEAREAEEKAAAAAKKTADEEEARKKKEKDEADQAASRRALEEASVKRADEAKAASAKKAEDEARATASSGGYGEVLARIEENRKKHSEQTAQDESAHKASIAKLNEEWDAKIAALEEADKAEEASFQSKLEELKKIGS